MNLRHVRLLLETPTRPIFKLVSDEGETFDLDEDSIFIAEDLKEQFEEFIKFLQTQSHSSAHLRGRKIHLRVPKNIPKFISKIKKQGSFSTFTSAHVKEASQLIEIFTNCQAEDLISIIAYYRDRLNPHLFYFALNIALMNRKDTPNIIGNVIQSFPFKFANRETLDAIRKRAINGVVSKGVIREVKRPCSTEIERRLDYFREDIGINSHHWHWHLVYFNGQSPALKKDRRGELFYYMHQQFLARYDAERLSNGLDRVKPFYDFREVNRQGYFPFLQMENSSKDYPGRSDNIVWQDVIRPDLKVAIGDLETYSQRVLDAIQSGRALIADEVPLLGKNPRLFENLTIDILGNMVEPSYLTPNFEYYGDVHAIGHDLTAWIHDPENKNGEINMGVIGDTATAVRDPIFFKWHKYIDNIFNKFKTNTKCCPIYTRDELIFNDIKVEMVNLIMENEHLSRPKILGQNELITYLEYSTTVPLNGLDFEFGADRKPIRVEMQHLNHVPFTYRFKITNDGPDKKGTIRTFIAPKFDSCGVQFPISEQRRLFIEMDRFDYELIHGMNYIVRKSTESSVTIPTDRIFDVKVRDPFKPTDDDEYCSCGWPAYMLLPKGTASGMTFQLFVMVSNFKKDKVDPVYDNEKCSGSAFSYCGLKDEKYPDIKDMGYPFDRSFSSDYVTIENFINGTISNANGTEEPEPTISNMFVKDFVIRFDEKFNYQHNHGRD